MAEKISQYSTLKVIKLEHKKTGVIFKCIINNDNIDILAETPEILMKQIEVVNENGRVTDIFQKDRVH